MTEQSCVYNISTNQIIDTIHNDSLFYSKDKSLNDLLDTDSNLQVLDIEFAAFLKDASHVNLPKQIDQERFDYLHHSMPPVDYLYQDGNCTFKSAEKVTGDISLILAKVGFDYFEFQDFSSLTHQQIVDRIQNKNDILVSTKFGKFTLKVKNCLYIGSLNFNYGDRNYEIDKFLAEVKKLNVGNSEIRVDSQQLIKINNKDYSNCRFTIVSHEGNFFKIYAPGDSTGLTEKGKEKLNEEFSKIYDAAIKPHLAYLILREKQKALKMLQLKLETINDHVSQTYGHTMTEIDKFKL